MLHIEEVIVVEGKYDKERLKKLTDAPILCTNGFEIYRSKRLLESIRSYAKSRGILILTDSDRAGFKIRNYLKQCLGPDCTIKNLYIPAIPGKERRKEKPGKEGLLGVEGLDDKTLSALLAKAAAAPSAQPQIRQVTKADFYADGLSGKPDSAEKRRAIARALHLPPRISANALLEFINKTCGYDGYRQVCKHL